MHDRAERIKEDPGLLIEPAEVERACAAAGHRWRERTLGPLETLSAMALQMLYGNTAIAHVVHLLGDRFSESAYCQARARLPVAVVRAQLDAFTRRTRDVDPAWRGHRVVLIDGTGVSTPDTPQLRGRIGTAGGVGDGCGLPCAKVLTVFRGRDGALLDMRITPACTGDLRHARDLHPALAPGDVLVGDRGFCAYVHLAELAARGCHGLFRVQTHRALPFPARRGKRRRLGGRCGRHRRSEPVLVELITRDDQVVELVKPHNRPASMTPEAFAAIPGKLVVRAVRYRVPGKGCRTREVTLLSTLIDAERYSAADLAELYLMRWRVEVNLRHLKRTIGMDRLRCGSFDGVAREALMLALIYNAVCRLRALSAVAKGVEPTRLSFIDALRVLRAATDGHRPGTTHPPDLKLWPLRPPRAHPRQLKRAHSHYPILLKPRADYIAWFEARRTTN
jgi:hypothetical protein